MERLPATSGPPVALLVSLRLVELLKGLFASLHFVSRSLPQPLFLVVQVFPNRKESCILVIEFLSGLVSSVDLLCDHCPASSCVTATHVPCGARCRNALLLASADGLAKLQ